MKTFLAELKRQFRLRIYNPEKRPQDKEMVWTSIKIGIFVSLFVHAFPYLTASVLTPFIGIGIISFIGIFFVPEEWYKI